MYKKNETRALSSKTKMLEFFVNFQFEILKMDIKSMSIFQKSIQELEKSCDWEFQLFKAITDYANKK